jgi:DNA (cytosine-5)-methyltransferase 1
MSEEESKIHLENLYRNSLEISSDESYHWELSPEEEKDLDVVIQNSERSKGVLTVLITSLLYKIENPEQDIRNHQAKIPAGYAGRNFDTRVITPFLKDKQFPAMSESGWLTRSLEQSAPYTRGYKGSIKPDTLKHSFLELINLAEEGGDYRKYLLYILVNLIKKRDCQKIKLARPTALPIKNIIDHLERHFNFDYKSPGASRLPVLSIYAAYQCLVNEIKRFEDKTLLSLESHTSADLRSGRIGDIDVINAKEEPFEAIEIKHNIPISIQLVKDAFDKLRTTRVERYYLLSTIEIEDSKRDEIFSYIEKVKQVHGCQIVVNGVSSSLKYYLRFVNPPKHKTS